MDEKRLKNIALIVGCFGLFGLFFLSKVIVPPEFLVSDLNEAMIDNPVRLSGSISNLRNLKTVSMASLDDGSGKVILVSFDGFPDGIITNDEVVVDGKVQVYNGELEIIVSEIILN